jgi:crossover junction endodeoxyribonuclease RusA
VLLTLPYPPSVNHYWRRVGRRTLISREGRTFRRDVCALLTRGRGNGPRKPPAGGRIALMPSMRFRRIGAAATSTTSRSPCSTRSSTPGVYEDDSQIDLLITRRGAVDARSGRLTLAKVAGISRCDSCPVCGGQLGSFDAELN